MRDCPSSEELDLFLSAGLSDGRAADVRAHISSCGRCQEELDRLTASEALDEWKAIGRTLGPAPAGPEPGLARLLDALRSNPPESTTDGPEDAIDTEPDDGAGSGDWRAALGPPARPGDLGTLGPYLVEAELGRGGMGIVLRAYDPGLERRVALKVLRPDRAHPRARRRLVREARAAARVRHDHLVAVYAVVDPPEGLPYLVMEYLAGPTLGRMLDPGGGIEPRRAAELVAQVADGLAAAHDAGLVHRDIKPDNIMIDPATGRAKLMDFGLARDESGGESLTREDLLAGTPTHMSPEQAHGQPLDGRSDVYSLGVTLYECLTGEVPFRGAPHMVIRQVCEDEPRPPRRLNDRIPRDLETIALKAMAKEPPARYATARELSEDLRRWLRGEPIRARPPGPVGRLARWCRRNARLAATAGVALGLLVLLSVVSSVAAVRIARAQRQTLKEHQAARDHYRLALESLNSLVLDVNQKLGNRAGTLALRRDILETARAGLEKIARSTEAEGAADRGAVVAHDQLGDVLFALGKTPDALRAYQRALALADAVAHAEPGSVQARRDLARAHDKLGDLSRYGNDIPAAEAAFGRANAIREELIRRDGQDPDARRDLQVSINKLGLIRLRRGEYAAALDQFRRALALLEEYAPSYPSRTKVLSDYEYTYRQLGQACLMSDWKQGVEYSRKALASARAVVAAQPQDLWLRKKLAIDLDQLAAGLWLLGDLDGAEAHYREAQRMRQADLAAEPGDVENRRNAAVSLQMLGNVARYRRDHDAAARLYRECLSICEALAESDPGSAQKQGDVLEVQGLLADNAERAERLPEALEWVEMTRHRLDRLEREGRPGRAAIAQARALSDALRPLYRAAIGGMRWDAVASARATPADLPPALHDGWRILYAAGLARRGRHAEAAAVARDIDRRNPDDPIKLARAARILALCAAAVVRGRPDAALSAEERRLQDSYIGSSRDAARRVLGASPATAIDVFLEPDLELLLRRGVLEALARELGQATAAGAAKG